MACAQSRTPGSLGGAHAFSTHRLVVCPGCSPGFRTWGCGKLRMCSAGPWTHRQSKVEKQLHSKEKPCGQGCNWLSFSGIEDSQSLPLSDS